jgi:pectate lyase
MAIKHIGYILLSVLLCACGKTEPEQQAKEDPALAAACRYVQGGASEATGGKGGTVYVVSTLADSINPADNKSVPGTLRHAVEQSEARLVIFRVAGIIHLKKPLVISKGNITIAGQSAPGDGICIADYPLQIKGTENVIVRFLRFRMGEAGSLAQDNEYDAVSVNDSKNVVLDHLSCSWSVDECVSCYGNTNFTMQYCFITESLKQSVHGKGNHGYGGIWGGTNATFHHNLLAHHDSRNPRFDHDYVDAKCAGPIDYVNNVVYNWGGNSTYGGEGTTKGAGGRHINMVNNYYKYGPATKAKNRLVDPTVSCGDYCIKHVGGTLDPGKFFLSGNYMFGDKDVTDDNWKGSTQTGSNVKAAARWTDGLTALADEQTAEEAYQTVLAKAGCSLKRDAIDARIVEEVKAGNGRLIDTPSDVGGWPAYTGERPADTDADGIPDEWEKAHGLNPDSYGDSRKETLVPGYTNLEVYLNCLVQDLY